MSEDGVAVKGIAYISGPMTGLPDFNFPEFSRVTERWRTAGWEVWSPAEMDGDETTLPRPYYMRRDAAKLIEIAEDARDVPKVVAMLAGWQRSEGACFERACGIEFGLEVYDALTMQPYQERIEQEAHRLVRGVRQHDYGHPYNDFSKTAQMWSGLLRELLKPGKSIQPEHVAWMMVLLKASREMNAPKRDNLVDSIGYILTAEMVEEEAARLRALAAE